MNDYTFPQTLVEGLIKSRPNRFLMNVEINGILHLCHCPATGTIGNVVFRDIPCLLSPAVGERKTSHTVEAVNLNSGGWIGINQGAVNRYIEHFLRTRRFPFAFEGEVKREVKLGLSRLDFCVGSSYIEVKTPLIELPCGPGIELRPPKGLTSFDRLVKHLGDLADSLGGGQRALMLVCFVYDAPLFNPLQRGENIPEIIESVARAMARGLEMWQVNMELSPEGVSLKKCFDISRNFL